MRRLFTVTLAECLAAWRGVVTLFAPGHLAGRARAIIETHMNDDIIISPAAEPDAPRAVKSRLQLASKAAMITGAVMIALSLAALIGFAAYPLFSGQGVREFFISFPVPFLISLMGLVPGALLYFTGRHVLRKGPNIGAGVIAGVLAAPLPVFGLWLLPELGVDALMIRAVLTLIGLALLVWGISIIRVARRLRASALT